MQLVGVSEEEVRRLQEEAERERLALLEKAAAEQAALVVRTAAAAHRSDGRGRGVACHRNRLRRLLCGTRLQAKATHTEEERKKLEAEVAGACGRCLHPGHQSVAGT